MDPITTPYELCGHKVPGIWRFLLPSETHTFRLPEERRATCDNCPMVRFDSHDPLFRCCAYHPLVPGFMLGFGLKIKESRKAIKNLLNLGYLTPEGYQRTPVQWIDYLADLSEEVEGEKARVKCPMIHPQSGLCTIYPFRNGVCSTFFCLNDHGDTGSSFWESLEELVSHVEVALHQWALEQAGFDVAAYFQRLEKYTKKIRSVTDEKTRGWHPSVLKVLWGSFYGHELELFKRSAEYVEKNRDHLWDIAKDQKILDAPKFERAMVKMVPKKYEDEIDPDDLEEDSGEDASVMDLWRDCKKAYFSLWKFPDQLVLNQRALILPNPKNDKESKEQGHFPYMVAFLKRTGGKSHEWREFVSKQCAEALISFDDKEIKNAYSIKALKKIKEPSTFLAEWHAKGVLRKAKTV